MFIIRLMQHVWNKVYFNVDLPKNRNDKCDATISMAIFDFFVPTTKRKNSISQWLGSTNKVISIPKAIFLILVDAIFFAPRLILNIIKLITEVLPLTLRELSYASFEDMLERVKKKPEYQKGLYKLAAGVCWLFTSLCSLIYFFGCLISSPGYTILAMKDTFKELGYPNVGNLAAFLTYVAFLWIYSFIIAFVPPFAIPGLAVFMVAIPAPLVGVFIFYSTLIAQLIFNTEPEQNHLTCFLERNEFFGYPETKISIQPSQFMKLFNEESHHHSPLPKTPNISIDEINNKPIILITT